MMLKKWKAFVNEGVKVKIRGYVRPADQFHTLGVWEKNINEMLALQTKGMSVRGAKITIDPEQPVASDRWLKLIDHFFGYLLEVETGRFGLTEKNVLDFIEDLINHRFWSIKKQYENYFPDIDSLKFGFLYSRGDIEPYVMIDQEFTEQFYGSTNNIKTVKHFTTGQGLKKILESIENEEDFDISTFTVVASPFFRDESNVIVTLDANVRAAFRSDIKSLALDNGRRAANLHRLDYPGEETNICPNLNLCDGELKTSLWNEIIATPVKVKEVDAPGEDILQEVEEYQKKVKAKHSKMKRRLIGKGGAKNVPPYNKKPSFKRSKSAPGPFAGS
jgi:hypothetical protein|tara:strand:+ start:1896 stop:2891 length:996 start_codon:yes stop_codon:yes gene_type:complete